jgi:hypothetical protein
LLRRPGPADALTGLPEVARLRPAERQGCVRAGRKPGGELEAAVQQLHTPGELAEIHAAEAQVAEVVGIIRVLAQERLQVDTGLVQAAGAKGLEGAGEVVVHDDGILLQMLSHKERALY